MNMYDFMFRIKFDKNNKGMVETKCSPRREAANVANGNSLA